MKIEFRYQYEDFNSEGVVVQDVAKRIREAPPKVLIVLLLMLLSIALILGSSLWLVVAGHWGCTLSLLLPVLIVFFLVRARKHNEIGAQDTWNLSPFNAEWQLYVNDGGVLLESSQIAQFMPWNAVEQVVESSKAIRVGNRSAMFYVPLRAFRDKSQRVDFLQEVRRRSSG